MTGHEGNLGDHPPLACSKIAPGSRWLMVCYAGSASQSRWVADRPFVRQGSAI